MPDLGLLRFITCGSVDDGKSTLIGRLLHDTRAIPDDQVATLARDSRRHGTTGDEPDLALLMDGLQAEREQGITIDVAYRFITTARRRFIVADTPGHEHYTRNMATGASTADLAILLVDARKGMLTQTRRHALIVSLLGIRHVVLAVNKIDLIGFDQGVFDAITADFQAFGAPLGFATVTAIPLSARYGDNVAQLSERTPWYFGPALLEHLEQVEVTGRDGAEPFRMPVQWVNRRALITAATAVPWPRASYGWATGLVNASGGKASTVSGLLVAGAAAAAARAGDAVTIELADEIDVSRGDLLTAQEAVVGTVDPIPGPHGLARPDSLSGGTHVPLQARNIHGQRQHHPDPASHRREHGEKLNADD